MKSMLWMAGVCAAALTVACAVEENGGPDEQTVEVSTAGDEVALTGLSNDDLAPAVETADVSASATNCVHIQWCNERGPVGTVCYWHSFTCDLDEAWAECARDARAVCGRTIQPAELRYPH